MAKKYYIMRRYLLGMAGEKATDWERLKGYPTLEEAKHYCPENYSLTGDDQYMVQAHEVDD